MWSQIRPPALCVFRQLSRFTLWERRKGDRTPHCHGHWGWGREEKLFLRQYLHTSTAVTEDFAPSFIEKLEQFAFTPKKCPASLLQMGLRTWGDDAVCKSGDFFLSELVWTWTSCSTVHQAPSKMSQNALFLQAVGQVPRRHCTDTGYRRTSMGMEQLAVPEPGASSRQYGCTDPCAHPLAFSSQFSCTAQHPHLPGSEPRASWSTSRWTPPRG